MQQLHTSHFGFTTAQIVISCTLQQAYALVTGVASAPLSFKLFIKMRSLAAASSDSTGQILL